MTDGPVAQRIERPAPAREVAGSTPAGFATPDAPEPWDIASAREHGVRDVLAILLLGAAALAFALLPPVRLVVHTALRFLIGGVCLLASYALPDAAARVAVFVGTAFAFLALIGLAAHVEGVLLTPIIDRIAGRDRP